MRSSAADAVLLQMIFDNVSHDDERDEKFCASVVSMRCSFDAKDVGQDTSGNMRIGFVYGQHSLMGVGCTIDVVCSDVV